MEILGFSLCEHLTDQTVNLLLDCSADCSFTQVRAWRLAKKYSSYRGITIITRSHTIIIHERIMFQPGYGTSYSGYLCLLLDISLFHSTSICFCMASGSLWPYRFAVSSNHLAGGLLSFDLLVWVTKNDFVAPYLFFGRSAIYCYFNCATFFPTLHSQHFLLFVTKMPSIDFSTALCATLSR